MYQTPNNLVAPHVAIPLGSTVIRCDLDLVSPSAIFKSGEVTRAGLILGANGVKNCIQWVVLRKPIKPLPMGEAAYWAITPASSTMQDLGVARVH